MSFWEAAEVARPWLTSTAIVGLFALVVNFWVKNRQLSLDAESGIRDHYAKELAALREQILKIQEASDARVANAEARYTEAVQAADRRHHDCEAECDRLRERVAAIERKYVQLHRTTLRLFQPRGDLPPEVLEHIRSLEQMGLPVPKKGSDDE